MIRLLGFAFGRVKCNRLFSGCGVEQLVACQAHNLKVVGSNPAPATIFGRLVQTRRLFCALMASDWGNTHGSD
jgi:hypothetical protein